MSYSAVRLLLDTTYLLPILGVEVRGLEEAIAALRSLYAEGRVKLYYSPFSILEALGKICRGKYDPERVGEGLSSILESGVFSPALPTAGAYFKALELRARGFRDLIDLLLYATAREGALKFLTRDRELLEFLEGVGEDLDCVITEEELKRLGGGARPQPG